MSLPLGASPYLVLVGERRGGISDPVTEESKFGFQPRIGYEPSMWCWVRCLISRTCLNVPIFPPPLSCGFQHHLPEAHRLPLGALDSSRSFHGRQRGHGHGRRRLSRKRIEQLA